MPPLMMTTSPSEHMSTALRAIARLAAMLIVRVESKDRVASGVGAMAFENAPFSAWMPPCRRSASPMSAIRTASRRAEAADTPVAAMMSAIERNPRSARRFRTISAR